MSKEIVQGKFTKDQVELIRSTVAKGATDDELKLFFYRCEVMGLDPLKPGQVHFIKYGSNPGTMVVGIEGFRARAMATGKHRGTERGLMLNDKGELIGGWAEVSRSGWTVPAREEVLLSEYNTGKSMWAKMPGTMIKKVAEVAALRMAFPDELGGVYSNEEMHQADPVRTVYEPQMGVHESERTETGPGFEHRQHINDLVEQLGFKDQERMRVLQAVDKANGDAQELKRIVDKLKTMVGM